jgi:hypothetical protein
MRLMNKHHLPGHPMQGNVTQNQAPLKSLVHLMSHQAFPASRNCVGQDSLMLLDPRSCLSGSGAIQAAAIGDVSHAVPEICVSSKCVQKRLDNLLGPQAANIGCVN